MSEILQGNFEEVARLTYLLCIFAAKTGLKELGYQNSKFLIEDLACCRLQHNGILTACSPAETMIYLLKSLPHFTPKTAEHCLLVVMGDFFDSLALE